MVRRCNLVRQQPGCRPDSLYRSEIPKSRGGQMCWGVRTPTHLPVHHYFNRHSAATPTRPASPQYAVTTLAHAPPSPPTRPTRPRPPRPTPASPSPNCSRHAAASAQARCQLTGRVVLGFRPNPLGGIFVMSLQMRKQRQDSRQCGTPSSFPARPPQSPFGSRAAHCARSDCQSPR